MEAKDEEKKVRNATMHTRTKRHALSPPQPWGDMTLDQRLERALSVGEVGAPPHCSRLPCRSQQRHETSLALPPLPACPRAAFW